MSVYQDDVSKLFKHLLLKYETHVTEVKDKRLNIDHMTIVEVSILEYIAMNQELTQQGLVNAIECKRKKALASLQKLLKADLVKKNKNPEDKRCNWLVLSPKGQAFLDSYKVEESRFTTQVLKDMTVNEEKAIVKFLSKINQTDYIK